MTENRRIWDQLFQTDPRYTKAFKRSGGFKGTAISPMYAVLKMTELFGPIGTGWGVRYVADRIVQSPDTHEVLVFVCAEVWYKEHAGDAVSVAGPQWGGDKVVTKIRGKDGGPDRFEADDEAFKKAFTDAITKCLSWLGLGGDVHMGLYDDSKYVNSLYEQIETEASKPAQPEPTDQQRHEFSDLQQRIIAAYTMAGAEPHLASTVIEGYVQRFKQNPHGALESMLSFTVSAEQKAAAKVAREKKPEAPKPEEPKPSKRLGKQGKTNADRNSEAVARNWEVLAGLAKDEGMTPSEWEARRKELYLEWIKDLKEGDDIDLHIITRQMWLLAQYP